VGYRYFSSLRRRRYSAFRYRHIYLLHLGRIHMWRAWDSDHHKLYWSFLARTNFLHHSRLCRGIDHHIRLLWPRLEYGREGLLFNYPPHLYIGILAHASKHTNNQQYTCEQSHLIEAAMFSLKSTAVWPNWLFKLTPTLRLVPSSRCAPYGAA
jgi:hypothetical protein